VTELSGTHDLGADPGIVLSDEDVERDGEVVDPDD
jgi:hypothetical protein